MKYVLNVVFSKDRNYVLMILKNRPSFLANLYNVVGGKIENNRERILDAAARETLEESNVNTNPSYFGSVFGYGYSIELCRSFTDDIFNAKTMEDEPIEVLHIDNVRQLHKDGKLAPNTMLHIENALLVESENFINIYN
jgi:8-oxo-dGTP pyrophosphatase MutT (NUDIX family)